MIFVKIENDEAINRLDDILDTSSVKDSKSLIEKIKSIISNTLPAIGLTAASVTDDFFAKLGPIASAVTS